MSFCPASYSSVTYVLLRNAMLSFLSIQLYNSTHNVTFNKNIKSIVSFSLLLLHIIRYNPTQVPGSPSLKLSRLQLMERLQVCCFDILGPFRPSDCHRNLKSVLEYSPVNTIVYSFDGLRFKFTSYKDACNFPKLTVSA